MSTWREILDVLIPRARASGDPIGALLRLFEAERRDGAVAFALGEEYEGRGNLVEALHWFQTAEERFPCPEYKGRAQNAASRVRRRLGEDPSAPVPAAPPETSPGETLYVVSCTKSKVWDDPAAARFVPAALAYTGATMRTWRESGLASQGVRWLILSAKYGFIEPDHPIAAYDVTFSVPTSGPVSDATLAAQAAHQVRWSDQIPLRGFGRVVVLGSAAYLERVRGAFAPLGIRVDPWEPGASLGAREPPAKSADRSAAVGRALGELPAAVFDAADRGEPEWPVLERLARLPRGLDVVATLALALSDYQLGPGGAVGYWAEAGRLLENRDIRETGDLRGLMGDLMAAPVGSRLADQKLARIDRLLGSALPQRVAGGVSTVKAESLWGDLSDVVGGSRDAKTIVFAMKTIDLLHRQATGRRMALPDDLPIPVDLRIARVSLAAGLLPPPPGLSVIPAMEEVEPIAADRRGEIIEGWRGVAREVGLAAPALDSLLWQLAEPLHAERCDAERAEFAVAALMGTYGAPPEAARLAAAELTWALGRRGSA